MSRMTKEINKVTGTIISVAGRLIVYAVILMLLIEGVSRGYAFGYEVFSPTAVDAAPGRDEEITVKEGLTDTQKLRLLKDKGLIRSDLIALIQLKFYDYEIHPGTYWLNTSMTSREILQALNEGQKEAGEESQPKLLAQPETQAESSEADLDDETTTGAAEPIVTEPEAEVEIQIDIP